jgi:hypothetical protein
MHHWHFMNDVHLVNAVLSLNVASHPVVALSCLAVIFCAVPTGGSAAVEVGRHHLEPVLFLVSWPGVIIYASQFSAC